MSMNEKTTSVIQKAQQERKRAQFGRALKRLEQGIAANPDELDLYLEAIDTAIEGGELLAATNHLKTVQEKFTRERDRVLEFVRDRLRTVHDPTLARCVVEHAVKRRDLDSALELLTDVPDHTIRELLNRARNKAQSLKSASHSGHTVRGDTVSNELTNAVLSLRLGNLKDAMETFVKVVEDKPVEHKVLEPFFVALAAKHPKSGRVRHARACAHRAGGNEIDAIAQLVEAARLENACAADSIDLLRAMLANPTHPGKIRRGLAEVQLVKGDFNDAAETLRAYLTDNPENSREVIMLLRPFIEPGHGLTACTWLAIEQALGIEQSSVALEILRGLHQRGGFTAELYEWLEERAQNGSLPADVMMFHGSLAIEQKEFERAIEILEAVCSTSKQDVHAVLAIIDRHRNAHPLIDVLYRQHAPREERSGSSEATTSDETEFQSFESSEFHLETPVAKKVPAPPAGAKEKPKVRFSSSPFSSAAEKTSPGGNVARKSFIDARELSLDDDGAGPRAEGASAVNTPAPTIEVTEEHVSNVAQKLYEAGAAAFFHIEDTATPDDTVETAPAAEPEARPAEAPTPAPTPAVETFTERYARFKRGELSNSAILVLLDEATTDGQIDELYELLFFEPETGAEHFSRYYYRSEYLLLRNLPLQALEILARIDTPDLDHEQKRRVWYKIAIAQRMSHNYEGAATTIDRLIEHYPNREEFTRLKRRNHEQLLAEQAMAAPTLEKTSSLD